MTVGGKLCYRLLGDIPYSVAASIFHRIHFVLGSHQARRVTDCEMPVRQQACVGIGDLSMRVYSVHHRETEVEQFWSHCSYLIL